MFDRYAMSIVKMLGAIVCPVKLYWYYAMTYIIT